MGSDSMSSAADSKDKFVFAYLLTERNATPTTAPIMESTNNCLPTFSKKKISYQKFKHWFLLLSGWAFISKCSQINLD